MCLMLFIALMAVMSTVSAQSSCTNVLISMAPCLGYITQNTSTPSQQCCSQLAHVVRYSSECLCEVLDGGGSQLGINVNETQALALPKACHVETPPASRCNSKIDTHYHLFTIFCFSHIRVYYFQVVLRLIRIQDHQILQVKRLKLISNLIVYIFVTL